MNDKNERRNRLDEGREWLQHRGWPVEAVDEETEPLLTPDFLETEKRRRSERRLRARQLEAVRRSGNR